MWRSNIIAFGKRLIEVISLLDRYTKVPDQPYNLLLVGGEPGEHKLRRDVQPSCHHAVEERTLHHLRRGNSQHPGTQRRGQVCTRGESESRTVAWAWWRTWRTLAQRSAAHKKQRWAGKNRVFEVKFLLLDNFVTFSTKLGLDWLLCSNYNITYKMFTHKIFGLIFPVFIHFQGH